MAKKLLDMSGKDSCTVQSAAVTQPFIGNCSDVIEKGRAITCVTPGSQAEFGALKTGDLVIRINMQSMVNSDLKELEKVYCEIVKTIETDDVVVMNVDSAGERKSTQVTVGSISHPA